MPAKHEQMRSTNTLLVLDHIRQNNESTRRSIQQATELSWAAVSNISSDLIARSVLHEQMATGKTAGRAPGFLDFTPMHNLTIGMEVNASGILAQLFDLRCSVVDSITEQVKVPDRECIVNQILDCVEKLISRNDLRSESILGIGIATQGSVSRDGSKSLYNSFFNDWRNVALKEILEEKFSIPTHVMHDPVCIALAEQWQRKFTEDNDFALIRLSYGIGMSYIAQGQPVIGYDGFAGEMGHMVLDRNGPTCSCGNRGCLESYSSIRGLSHRIMEEYSRGTVAVPEELLQVNDHDVQSMTQLVAWSADIAREGHPVMKRMFDDAGYYLGMGIANIVSLFNPEYVILTGELLEYRDLFLAGARAAASYLAWGLSKYDIILSNGGRQQASSGAALYFINQAFSSMESKLLDQSAE